jgi:SAM-dependent methyltransferase
MTEKLFEKYYYSRSFKGGTIPFWDLFKATVGHPGKILEIGAGPSNPDSEFFATLGPVTGVDVSDVVLTNRHLTEAFVYDGLRLPFPDHSFDSVVSNWALEHLERPEDHFAEVARVLRPGGYYCFRTMNLYHYVSFGSRMLPHSLHLLLSNRLRGLSEAVDPYRTYYRANTRGRLNKIGVAAGFKYRKLVMLEPEPSYGKAHAALFYPMMWYERLVNSTDALKGFRVTILGFFKQKD